MSDEYTLHKTSYGETWDSIAFAYYDDPFYANSIIEENPDYADILIFEEVVTLKIPEINMVEMPSTLPPWRR